MAHRGPLGQISLHPTIGNSETSPHSQKPGLPAPLWDSGKAPLTHRSQASPLAWTISTTSTTPPSKDSGWGNVPFRLHLRLAPALELTLGWRVGSDNTLEQRVRPWGHHCILQGDLKHGGLQGLFSGRHIGVV